MNTETRVQRDLANRIGPVLQEHFEHTHRGPSFYEYSLVRAGLWHPLRGEVDEVISSIACLDDEVACDIRDLLSDSYAYEVKDGGDDPYEIGADYVERESDDSEFRLTWASFRYEIRSRTRFFSTDAEQALREIFGCRSHTDNGNQQLTGNRTRLYDTMSVKWHR